MGYDGHARFARDKSPGLHGLVSDNELGHGRSRSRSPFSHQEHRRGLEKASPRAGSPLMRPQRDFRIRPRSQSIVTDPQQLHRNPLYKGMEPGLGIDLNDGIVVRRVSPCRDPAMLYPLGPWPRELGGEFSSLLVVDARGADVPGPHPQTPDLVVGRAPRARFSPLVGRASHLTVITRTRSLTRRA